MKTSYKIKAIFFLSAICITSSCKKVIDLQLADASSQMVIEGNITDVPGPQSIIISRSVPFDNTNTYPPVSGATVKANDTFGRTYIFTERAAGTYTINSLTGRYGETYTLQVVVNGQTYKAKSMLPDPKVRIDSLSFDSQIIGNDDTKTISVYYQDPSYYKNQYRFILNVNGVEVKRIFARNDQFNDGRHVQVKLYQDDIKIKKGDKIDVEMQCIDAVIYNYWYTFSLQQADFGATTPTNPVNNFDNNVLGYFSAHTTQHATITVN